MPTLILPPRYTDDSVALWRAAMAMGWTVTRLQGWRITSDSPIDEPVLYGEPLFVAAPNSSGSRRSNRRLISWPACPNISGGATCGSVAA
jgi:hypothetical protein